MNEIIIPVLIFALLGALAGTLLVIASKLFHVETDERAAKVLLCLPGANCGGCGYSGCEGYAAAVSKGEAPIDLCKPGGADVMNNIGLVLGLSGGGKFIRETAFVRCNGSCENTKDRYIFAGTKSCAAANRFYNGKGECRFGCLGYGDCAAVCEHNAIKINLGVAAVNGSVCVGCGRCVKVCPNHLIFMRKETEHIAVRCSSADTGKTTAAICKSGCIACKICERKCPEGAVSVSDNHAIIDYNKCTGCGICAAACPKKCIVTVNDCAASDKGGNTCG